jgi:hypothetical protein
MKTHSKKRGEYEGAQVSPEVKEAFAKLAVELCPGDVSVERFVQAMNTAGYGTKESTFYQHMQRINKGGLLYLLQKLLATRNYWMKSSK